MNDFSIRLVPLLSACLFVCQIGQAHLLDSSQVSNNYNRVHSYSCSNMKMENTLECADVKITLIDPALTEGQLEDEFARIKKAACEDQGRSLVEHCPKNKIMGCEISSSVREGSSDGIAWLYDRGKIAPFKTVCTKYGGALIQP